ncbi:MSHA biogenesis protein MshI [Marinobacter daqiaonensis]|uniref:MSHA biogenesis protein MshI n=1 Tax=Marinobacter daqiaonensis TaxID=650891 RepID=A0A1I6K168_9GAMM|nr:PilN domain-containing protein [Marinobacter daqiaonensis]SFR84924.1 MSHA biogenesis protein MshI [Marinobacter daqiaonensis]
MIQQVNLYKAEFQPRRQKLTAFTLILLSVAALVVVLAVGGWFRYEAGHLSTQVAAERADNEKLLATIDRLGQEVQARRPDPELEGALERVTQTLERRRRLLERVERLTGDRSDGFAAPMAALARQVPDELWLTHVLLSGNRVMLEGRTRAGRLVPLYLERLGEEPAFTGQGFGRFELSRGEDHPWIDFRVATRRDGEDGS